MTSIEVLMEWIVMIVEKDNLFRFVHFNEEAELERGAKDRVSKKTLKNNRWSARAWESWETWRNEQPLERALEEHVYMEREQFSTET